MASTSQSTLTAFIVSNDEKKKVPIKEPPKKKRKYEDKRKKPDDAATSTDEKGPTSPKRGRPPGSKAKCVITELLSKEPNGAKRLWGLWKNHYTTSRIPAPNPRKATPCMIWKGGKKEGGKEGASFQNGYAVITMGHGQSRIYAHVLAHYINTAELPQAASPKLDVSHLCHNKKCFNPTHLTRESVEANCSRDHCLCSVKVGDRLINLCRHQPPCLAPGLATQGFLPTDITEQ